jgi:glycosyltransferase involved in cell wall biosynthesis
MTDRIVVLHLRSSVAAGGGPEKTIYNTGRFLNQQQFLYLVAYLTKKSQSSEIAQKGMEEGMNYFHLPGAGLFDLRQFREIMRIIRKYKVQILHCHDPKTDSYGIILHILFPELKLISTLHGWIQRTWKSVVYNKLDEFFLRRFHQIIAVSESIAKKARSFGIRHILIIYNAIDTNEWSPVEKSRPKSPKKEHDEKKPFIIGYVGRISGEKGPLDFVRVASALLQQDKNHSFEFVVAGEGPEADTMKRFASELGIAHHFRFVGQIPNRDMPLLYSNLDLLLSTSVTEGLPNNILEALAMKVPVIATNVGGTGEVITHNHNGLLVCPGDINSMVKSILLFKDSKDMAKRFRENGRYVIETRFSFKKHVENTEALYTKLANMP